MPARKWTHKQIEEVAQKMKIPLQGLTDAEIIAIVKLRLPNEFDRKLPSYTTFKKILDYKEKAISNETLMSSYRRTKKEINKNDITVSNNYIDLSKAPATISRSQFYHSILPKITKNNPKDKVLIQPVYKLFGNPDKHAFDKLQKSQPFYPYTTFLSKIQPKTEAEAKEAYKAYIEEMARYYVGSDDARSTGHILMGFNYKVIPFKESRKKRTGGFFQYWLPADFPDADYYAKHYQIYTKDYPNKDMSFCLCYALRQLGFDTSTYEHLFTNVNYSPLEIKKIVKDSFVIPHLRIHQGGSNSKVYTIRTKMPYCSETIADVLYYKNHYCVFERGLLKNLEAIQFEDMTQEEHIEAIRSRPTIKIDNPKIPPFFTNADLLYSDLKGINDVKHTYKSNEDVEGEECKEDSKYDYILAADTEAIVGATHKVNCISYTFIKDKDNKHNIDEVVNIWGYDCIKPFLDMLFALESNVLVYIHNLSYDIQFIYQECVKSHIVLTKKEIIKGSHVLRTYVRNIEFRDSYSLLPMRLDGFGSAFGLDETKDLFPYTYAKDITDLEKDINPQDVEYLKWSARQKSDFVKSFNAIHAKTLKDYEIYYCNLDVKVLAHGLLKFKEYIGQHLGLNIYKFLTIPSLAYQSMKDEIIKKAPTTKLTSNYLDAYIREAIHGGRVSVADSTKCHIIAPQGINDFDKVSLYPWAISTALFPTFQELPEVIKEGATKEELDKAYGYYVITVKITAIKSHLTIPTVIINKKFVHDDKDIELPQIEVIGKIALNDYITYAKIEYEILGGIGFKSVAPVLHDWINHLFNLRKKLKDEHNPAQNTIKLVMNSSYGKTYQRPIKTESQFIKLEDLDDFVYNNYDRIESCDLDIGRVRTYKNIYTQWSNSIYGLIILEQSKTIMNRLTHLCQNYNCPVYYTDTDSIHVLRCDEFNKVVANWGDELIGKELKHFHNDFSTGLLKTLNEDLDPSLRLKDKDIYAVESYFLGKKSYADKLKVIVDGSNYDLLPDDVKQYLNFDEDGKCYYTDYHFRMKGIPNSLLKWEDYERLYNNESITYNMLDGVAGIKINLKDFCIDQLTEFSRIISF